MLVVEVVVVVLLEAVVVVEVYSSPTVLYCTVLKMMRYFLLAFCEM